MQERRLTSLHSFRDANPFTLSCSGRTEQELRLTSLHSFRDANPFTLSCSG